MLGSSELSVGASNQTATARGFTAEYLLLQFAGAHTDLHSASNNRSQHPMASISLETDTRVSRIRTGAGLGEKQSGDGLARVEHGKPAVRIDIQLVEASCPGFSSGREREWHVHLDFADHLR